MSDAVASISKESWDKDVLQSQDVVMVDFWAVWCSPCKMISPIVEELAKDYKGKVKFFKINTDENPDLASQYKIRGIPTLMFFKKGQMVDQVVGVVPKTQLKAKLDSLLE